MNLRIYYFKVRNQTACFIVDIGDRSTFWLSCLCLFCFIAPKNFNYLALQPFSFERN
jgi:hypothetical protein